MKFIVRLFFRTLRRIIGPFLLLTDKITTPKSVVRQPEIQRQLDKITQSLALYQFKTCPFCIKVRREIKRQSLKIELRDAQHDPLNREELLNGGGKIKVPCLKVINKDGEHTWLYESNQVIQYLQELVTQPETV